MNASYLISYGEKGSLQYGELPEPVLKKQSVLVEVKAVSVNPVDWKTRQGALKILLGSKFPMIIGSDFAGIIKELAPGVVSFKAGDRVYGAIPAFSKTPGALAEIALVHQKDLRRMPDWLSFEEAASLPVAALTATNGLRRCSVQEGTRLLVNGATGGVGHFAVQAAKAKGAISNSDYHMHLQELELIPEKVKECLTSDSHIKEIAAVYKDMPNFLYLGRGFNFPVAL